MSPLPCTQHACCGHHPSQHPPHPCPPLLLLSGGIPHTHFQFPPPRLHAPTFSLRRPKCAPWHLKWPGSFQCGHPRATFIFSYGRTTHRGITIVILFLFTTVLTHTNWIKNSSIYFIKGPQIHSIEQLTSLLLGRPN